ncbi:hypothetical protein IPF37_04275 [bacterium]|nr:MAG: hypothetical protein IPF37_04275 [bacterium]
MTKVIIYQARAINQGCIYIYVGKTERTLDERRQEHEDKALRNSPRSFPQAMRKIPLDCWEWQELFVCEAADATEQENQMIMKYRIYEKNNPNFIVLNDTPGKNINQPDKNDEPYYGISKACRQKNYAPSERGKRFAMISGKLKPVKNLKTGQEYQSIAEAEKIDKNSKLLIKRSCETGRMLNDGTRYAYIDLDMVIQN